MDRNNEIWWGEDGNNIPAQKRFLTDVKQGVVPATMWFYQEAGHNAEAKNEIRRILTDSQQIFTTPKPIRLITRILQIATDSGDLVLDSFAGSGTTGHAVLQLNKEDGGNRRFILVEMEPPIARSITAVRLQRAIEGYEWTGQRGKVNREEALGGGFRYCHLGATLFDAQGHIRGEVTFADLAQHVFFTETGEPLPRAATGDSPLLGVANGVAVYLLYNGVLRDRSVEGGSVLTRAALASLPFHEGPSLKEGHPGVLERSPTRCT